MLVLVDNSTETLVSSYFQMNAVMERWAKASRSA